tara:strand:+ start:246 stop:872 length:627 start_codon:yes stop_codon:yes gene_type:complete
MNSKTVLSKIASLLTFKGEEKFTFAKLADGTILESTTFDVGETVDVVSEDGTKTPAPDGEHELELTGAEGETVRFKIITKGGVIEERENVELEEEVIETEPLPGDAPTEMAEEEVTEEELIDEESDTEKEEVTINLEEIVEKLSYRIDELEKKLAMAEEIIDEKEELEEDEEEDKKLDGAPVEMSKVISKGTKSVGYHNSVLSKLYKN